MGGRLRSSRSSLLIFLLLLSTAAANFDCEAQFSTDDDDAQITPILSTVGIDSSVMELADVGDKVIIITWRDGDVFGEPELDTGADTDDGREYLKSIIDVGTQQITVNVLKTLEGLPDYPDSLVDLEVYYTFPLIEQIPDDYTECVVRLKVKISDENTATPIISDPPYSTSIREDFPADYPLPDLQISASDADLTAPNNILTADVSGANCLLQSADPTYDASNGQQVPLSFVLTEKADFDTMLDPEMICNVAISDGGTPQKTTDIVLTVTVTAADDEKPVFKYHVYTSTLTDPEPPSGPLTIEPEQIHADDADKPSSTLTYSMEVDESDGGEYNAYFSIDPTTADVTQVQTLPDDMLDIYSVHFVVTAEDGGGNSDTAILEIILPEPPTTTSTTTTSTTTTSSTTTTPTTTTTSTTTTPTTTPTTTTPESTTLMTCPTCEPCETTPVPTTTTSSTTTAATTTTTDDPTTSTCPPCTTENPWTPTPTTTSTTPSTTITSTTTTPTTITGEPTEPSTCSPCTTEIVTCPTEPETTSTTTTSEGTTTPNPATSTTPFTTPITTTTSIPTTTGSASLATCPTCEPCQCTTDEATTEAPPGPSFAFEYQEYNFLGNIKSVDIGELRLVGVDDEADVPQDAVFEWDESSEHIEWFNLDKNGLISIPTDQTPDEGSYELLALATADGFKVETNVRIQIEGAPDCGDLFITHGLFRSTRSEDEEPGTIVTVHADGAKSYCVVSVSPDSYYDNFTITDAGELTVEVQLDADELRINGSGIVEVRVSALAEVGDQCPSTGADLSRSEALVQITVTDENDQAPVISDPEKDVTVGFPKNRGLQQVAGSIIQLQVTDTDIKGQHTFALSGEDAGLFEIVAETGEVYLTDPDECDDDCSVVVTANDGSHDSDPISITVTMLETDDIFDYSVGAMLIGDIEDEIKKLSDKTDLDLQLLYVSYDDSSENTRKVSVSDSKLYSSRNGQQRAGANKIAHIYGFEDGEPITLSELNEKLGEDSEQQLATSFSEKETFDPTMPEEVDVLGYQIAIGIIGSLFAIMVITGAVFFYRKRSKPTVTSKPQDVSTIGGAYPNHGFNDMEMDNMNTDGNSNRSVEIDISPKSYNNDNNNGDVGIYETTIAEPEDHQVSSGTPVAAVTVVEVERPRKASQHSLGGLRRIDPGPAPSGTRSSPYLTGTEGGFEASRSADKIDSFTEYQGGRDPSEKGGGTGSTSGYGVVRQSSSGSRADRGRPEMYPRSHSSSSLSETRGKDAPRESSSTKNNNSLDREANNKSKTESGNGSGSRVYTVRNKKEPPNPSTAVPAKSIMRSKKESSGDLSESNTDQVTPSSSKASESLAAKVQGSPPPKAKKKEKENSTDTEEKSKIKASVTSDGETTDSEAKKVAFKVLTSEKQIENREDSDSASKL